MQDLNSEGGKNKLQEYIGRIKNKTFSFMLKKMLMKDEK